ncbi:MULTISPECIES: carbohydrate ABC transporter permease [unclassified Arthrobacter]|uniref:carbohydrate ABC transporter permease n=1 Tax=unclassified Arthrobacter TaxID=235627 RepID=UPI001E590A2B|nr:MULTISPECIES: carbohydrate ABC transporter permease [unclassified Arthrobacter]MCC9144490.1 carbohydrate ABC transporter permease [Arthrobacter sp. zg-Y919]MDK1275716.1 carbohydrate ABC transporter permease [Arthrobacter sp. zg.Y919]WIB02917.1 carbohydrate ABC transporter permease [Arthrobacter sp. zg-Y919]
MSTTLEPTAPPQSTSSAHENASKRRRRKKSFKHGAVIALLSAWTLFALAPIVWIFMMSLKTPEDIISNPPKFFFLPTLANYAEVLSGPEFLSPFLNSLIVTIGALVLTLFIGLPTAYALARFKFKGGESIAFGILSLRFAPELLIILPLYLIYQKSNLNDTYLGLILAYQLVTLPMLVWMLRSFIEDLPRELEEAVAVDGGTRWTAFRHVLLRLIAPGLGASLMLSFIWAWNSYTLPLVLSGRDTQVITTGIQQYISFQSIDWGPMAAATIISLIPGILFALLSLRWVVDGLTAGTVKG